MAEPQQPPPSTTTTTAQMSVPYGARPDMAELRVITLVGENKGAYMDMTSASLGHDKKKLDKGAPRHHQYLHQHEENATCDGKDNGNGRNEDKNKEKGTSTTIRAYPMIAFVNSNVQRVENSILQNCSCAHNNPGVHLVLSPCWAFKTMMVDAGSHAAPKPGDSVNVLPEKDNVEDVVYKRGGLKRIWKQECEQFDFFVAGCPCLGPVWYLNSFWLSPGEYLQK